MNAVWVTKEEFDEVRSLVKNIKVTGGYVSRYGNGKNSGINIVIPSAPLSSGGGKYSGPFAVTKKDSTTVTIAAGVLVLGLTTIEFEETDLTISADGYAVLDITYSNSAYTVTASNVGSLPTQTATHYYIILAAVAFDTEAEAIGTITQYQYGPVQGSGRAF